MTHLWYPFYWGDYSSKAFHLTQGQHGAYFLLLRYIYTTGKPIPHEQCYSIAQAMLKQEQDNVDYVLGLFFQKKGDLWTNSRATEVMNEAEERHQRRADAGRKGGLKPARNGSKQCLSNAQAVTTTLTLKDIYIENFELFFNKFPKQRIGSKQKALSAWKAAITRSTEKEILGGLEAYIGSDEVCNGFGKGAAAWLNDDRWKSDYGRRAGKTEPQKPIHERITGYKVL